MIDKEEKEDSCNKMNEGVYEVVPEDLESSKIVVESKSETCYGPVNGSWISLI